VKNLWTIRSHEQFCTDSLFEFEETEWFEIPKPSAQVFRFNFNNSCWSSILEPHRTRVGRRERICVFNMRRSNPSRRYSRLQTRARCAAPRPFLQRLNRTLCTPNLKFTATSVADADPPNPWSCFAHHRFNRWCSLMPNAVDPRRAYLSAVDRVLFALVFACILFAAAYYIRWKRFPSLPSPPEKTQCAECPLLPRKPTSRAALSRCSAVLTGWVVSRFARPAITAGSWVSPMRVILLTENSRAICKRPLSAHMELLATRM